VIIRLIENGLEWLLVSLKEQRGSQLMSDEWQLATFQDEIGTSYDVGIGPSTVHELTLVDARPLSGESSNSESKRDPFSLIFHGPLEPILPQGIYRFRRDAAESMEIFIVPIGPENKAMRYEAIFT
jgi:hypothetical protein